MFTVDLVDLKTALPTLKKGNARSMVDVIHIVGSALSSEIAFQTTNLDVGVSLTLPIKRDNPQDRDFCLPFTAFEKVISGCGKGVTEIELEVEDETVSIKTGELETRLPRSKVEFFFFDTIDSQLRISTFGAEFADAVKSVSYATAKDETRPALNGIFMDVPESSMIFLTGCDGYRSSRMEIDALNPNSDYIVPGFSAILRNLDILPKIDTSLDIIWSEPDIGSANTIPGDIEDKTIGPVLLFRYPKIGLEIYMRKTEAVYPDLSQVVPNKFQAKLRLNRQRLHDGLKLVMAKEKGRIVKWEIEVGKAEMGDTGNEVLYLIGEEGETIVGETRWCYGEVEREQDDPETATTAFSATEYQGKFLEEYLSHSNGDTVRTLWSGPHTATVFMGEHHDHYDENFAIIMPYSSSRWNR